ncbi:MAG: hypothetical protein HQ541_18635 [Mariniphaga sp.]|nr:hypothetical protein [Mariniphaga sp.]
MPLEVNTTQQTLLPEQLKAAIQQERAIGMEPIIMALSFLMVHTMYGWS